MDAPFGESTNRHLNLNVPAATNSGRGGGEPDQASRSPEAPRIRTADLPDVDEFPPHDDEDHDVHMADASQDSVEELPPAGLFDHIQAFPGDGLPLHDRPLIAPLAPMLVLREEYENGSQFFVKQIDWLMHQGWIGVRRARGDGDCFYRALAFAYVENILNSSDSILAASSALSVLEATIPQLEDVGFQRLVFEDFYDCLAGLINQIVNPVNDRLLTIDMLLEAFNNPEVSNSIVVFLRLLTSAEIKTNPDYAAFLLHPETGEQMDPESFCNNFVEAVGKEAGVSFVHLFVSQEGRIRPASADSFFWDAHESDPHLGGRGTPMWPSERREGPLLSNAREIQLWHDVICRTCKLWASFVDWVAQSH